MSAELQILIVDDDPGQRSLLETFLADQGYRILTAASAEEAFAVLCEQNVAMMISDVRMPGLNGLEALKNLREKQFGLPVLMVTAYPEVRGAVEAMRDGAVNYLEKPIDLDELLANVRQALGARDGAARAETRPLELPPQLVAESPQLKHVLREVGYAAPSDAHILITGESGTGKRTIARLIHRNSGRGGEQLLEVDCAAPDQRALAVALFGAAPDATGGPPARGYFESAAVGTILLDQIGELSPPLQARLLHWLQTGTFTAEGSALPRRGNPRLLATSSQNLETAVESGTFREDLFFRLGVFEIYLPPLREREADIIPLASRFAEDFTHGRPRFSTGAMTSLKLYHWPGNVRELQNAMQRAALICRGGVILPEHLPQRVTAGAPPATTEQPEGRRIAEVERTVILQTLRQNNFNRSKSAKELGISRRALQYKLQRLRDEGFDV